MARELTDEELREIEREEKQGKFKGNRKHNKYQEFKVKADTGRCENGFVWYRKTKY